MAPEASNAQGLDRPAACCRGGVKDAESESRLEYARRRLVAYASAALAEAGLRPDSILGARPLFWCHSKEIGPQCSSVHPM